MRTEDLLSYGREIREDIIKQANQRDRDIKELEGYFAKATKKNKLDADIIVEVYGLTYPQMIRRVRGIPGAIPKLDKNMFWTDDIIKREELKDLKKFLDENKGEYTREEILFLTEYKIDTFLKKTRELGINYKDYVKEIKSDVKVESERKKEERFKADIKMINKIVDKQPLKLDKNDIITLTGLTEEKYLKYKRSGKLHLHNIKDTKYIKDIKETNKIVEELLGIAEEYPLGLTINQYINVLGFKNNNKTYYKLTAILKNRKEVQDLKVLTHGKNSNIHTKLPYDVTHLIKPRLLTNEELSYIEEYMQQYIDNKEVIPLNKLAYKLDIDIDNFKYTANQQGYLSSEILEMINISKPNITTDRLKEIIKFVQENQQKYTKEEVSERFGVGLHIITYYIQKGLLLNKMFITKHFNKVNEETGKVEYITKEEALKIKKEIIDFIYANPGKYTRKELAAMFNKKYSYISKIDRDFNHDKAFKIRKER